MQVPNEPNELRIPIDFFLITLDRKMSEHTGLKITIIGGGIAGLFAARVLREKHHVTILERSSGGNEVGAAVTPGPNATRILDQYGWDPSRCGALVLGKTCTMDHNGNLIKETDLSGIKQAFGSDWHVVHRIDLWNELLRLATAPSGDLGIRGLPAKVEWRAEVVDVDTESGDVKLGDGMVVPSDLVIGKNLFFDTHIPIEIILTDSES